MSASTARPPADTSVRHPTERRRAQNVEGVEIDGIAPPAMRARLLECDSTSAFAEAAQGPSHGILRVLTASIVSRDIVDDPVCRVFADG